MEQFIEFIGNHLILSALWLVAILAVLFKQKSGASKSVGPQQAVMLINRSDAKVVDIRDKKEFDSGHIVDALNIPLSKLDQRIAELDKHKDKPIVVVCKMGQHSSEACKKLEGAGHSQVVKLGGGLTEWKAQSLPLVQK
ncbi:MAG: rhodanese-like domain-containing protein [Gammaproteobacteria bacterium]|nr:rhodanese-like domain-containing protein [Gammaproteobacteria bacterium]